MKKSIFLFATFIFLSLNTFAQIAEESSVEDSEQTTGNDDYFPIIGDNSAFGYGEGNIFINTNLFTSDFENIYAHFLNAGISNSFSLSFGMLNVDFYNPEFLYLTPEFHFPISDNVTIGLELIGVFAAESLGDYILNPSFILSFGTNRKHLSIGYGPGINSDGDFEAMSPIDGFYSVAGIRLNGRFPIGEAVGVFSKNDYSSNNGATFFISRTGIEAKLSSFNIYAGMNLAVTDFGLGSNTEANVVLGVSYRVGG